MCSVLATTGARTALLISTNYSIRQSTNIPLTVNWFSTKNWTVSTECWLVYWPRPMPSWHIGQRVGWHSVECWPTCQPRCPLVHWLIYSYFKKRCWKKSKKVFKPRLWWHPHSLLHLNQWQTAAWSMVIKFSISLNLLRHTVKPPLMDTFCTWTPNCSPAISLLNSTILTSSKWTPLVRKHRHLFEVHRI